MLHLRLFFICVAYVFLVVIMARERG